jgi:hypothetical protein
VAAVGPWFTAFFIAAVLTASGTAAPQMNNPCSNEGFLQNWRTANKLFVTAVKSMNAGRLIPATAYVQRARNRVQSAPVPCNAKLLVARTYALKEYRDTLLALRADDDGDYSSASNYLQRAVQEQDVVAEMIRRWK